MLKRTKRKLGKRMGVSINATESLGKLAVGGGGI